MQRPSRGIRAVQGVGIDSEFANTRVQRQFRQPQDLHSATSGA